MSVMTELEMMKLFNILLSFNRKNKLDIHVMAKRRNIVSKRISVTKMTNLKPT
jgi:hypothetical protein